MRVRDETAYVYEKNVIRPFKEDPKYYTNIGTVPSIRQSRADTRANKMESKDVRHRDKIFVKIIENGCRFIYIETISIKIRIR